MRVVCNKTTISEPSDELRSSGWYNCEHYLSLGTEYTVYAIFHSSPDLDLYLVCTDLFDDNLNYVEPLFIPACFFDIIDDTKPAEWTMADDKLEGPKELNWENYEALVDGDPDQIQAFRQIMYRSICKTTLTVYLTTNNPHSAKVFLDSEDFFTASSKPEKQVIKVSDTEYRIAIASFSCFGLDTDPILNAFTRQFRDSSTTKGIAKKYNLGVTVELSISETDHESPLPAKDFTLDFLTICDRLEAPIIIVLNVTPEEATGEHIQGAYLEIWTDSDEWNSEEISRIAGVQPTHEYVKGRPGRYIEAQQHNGWEIKTAGEGVVLSESLEKMMELLKYPEELGRYCAGHNLNVCMDLVYYGLGATRATIAIPHSFISFCCELQVNYLDIDVIA